MKEFKLTDVARAATHTAGRIDSTPVVSEPFEHCVVDDVFPQDFLEALSKYWPSDDVLESLGETGRTSTDAYKERRVMLFEQRFFDKLSAQQLEFWKMAANVAMGKDVVLKCFKKFHHILQPRLSRLKNNAEIFPYISVVSDREGYSIGPHTDTSNRLMSLLYYLSNDPIYLKSGTSLYTPKDLKIKRHHKAHYPLSHFHRHSAVEYKPNRLLVFPRSDKSFHGVELISIPDCDRRLLIINVQTPMGTDNED